MFSVDERLSGRPQVPNDEVAAFAAEHADVAIAFASVDPTRGPEGVREARRLVSPGLVHGLKLHPPMQQFFPNDRIAYPLYEVFAEAKLPVLFHTGHSGIGTGSPGGGGVRLKYGHPMPIDDVAVDFPELPIIMAHPSFPWQDEAISICLHKPSVYIDLSGWSPKYFCAEPRSVRQYAAEAQGAVRVGLSVDHAGSVAGRSGEDRHPRGRAAADSEGQRRPIVRVCSAAGRADRDERNFWSSARRGPAGPPGRSRRARRVHASHPVRRRPRNHPAADPRSHADPDDARPAVRPDDRIGLRAASSCSRGAATPASARCIGCAMRWSRAWPRPLEIEEHSHAAMANAYAAGASGMPSAFFRGYRGSDLATVNPNIKFVACPFTGESLACVPALRPDVAIVHAQKADRAGNVLVEGIIGVQKEAVLAAASIARDCRGGRRAIRRRRDERGDPAVLGGRRRSRSCRAARIRRTRTATTSATTRSISRGTRSRAIASRSRRGCDEHVIDAAPDAFRAARVRPDRRIHGDLAIPRRK